MNRIIKFRSVFFNLDGTFSHFSYWGFINHIDKPDARCFKSPGTAHNRNRKFENQYIGLKDIDDKEIYENNIIESQIGYNHWYVVKFEDGCFFGEAIKNKNTDGIALGDTLFTNWKRKEYKNIGDIYQNPELLK